MRRAVARGRMFPQSYSTDRRYARLSLKAGFLFPMMWANADDQGRLCGDPEEIKYGVCPNIDHIAKTDVPGILMELQENKLILCYRTPKSPAIQMLDWWGANNKMQWAWPSDYPPPDGWMDHLRYKKDAKTVITENWPVSGERSGEDNNSAHLSTETPSAESSGEALEESPLTNPPINGKTIKRKRRGRGRGNSPESSGESSGEKPSPSPRRLSTREERIYGVLKENYCMRWGTVRAANPREIIPRALQAKAGAQLRDLAIELAAAGGCKDDVIKQAFDEAAKTLKFSISYVRAVLFAWLGIDRGRSP